MTGFTENKHKEPSCPLRATIRLLEGKYTLIILREMFSGTQRFNRLLKRIPGISRKTLADKLKHLTELGLVTRHAYAEVPPRVEYQLTAYGDLLKDVMGKLEILGGVIEQKADAAKAAGAQPNPAGYDCSLEDDEAAPDEESSRPTVVHLRVMK